MSKIMACQSQSQYSLEGKGKVALVIFLFKMLATFPPSSALVKHCDPNTDADRETLLQSYPDMRKYLDDDVQITNGRLGTIFFINYQDKLFKMIAPGRKECRWKIRSPYKKEEEKFNDKVHVTAELNADPLSTKTYYRLVSCVREDCIQYYNVFLRPITNPDFPVQIYEGQKRAVRCILDTMDDDKTKDYNEVFDQMPPYRFEWTGPVDCKEPNWRAEGAECVRYTTNHADAQTAGGHEFNADETYPNLLKQPLPAKFGYAKTKILAKGMTQKVKATGQEVKSQIESDLIITEASIKHIGKWRCIVYDGLGVSSHPDKKGSEFLDYQGIHHHGILYLWVKNFVGAIIPPLAITVVVIVWSVCCMMCCKQCTDYSPEQDEGEEDKTKRKSTAGDKEMKAEATQRAGSFDKEGDHHENEKQNLASPSAESEEPVSGHDLVSSPTAKG